MVHAESISQSDKGKIMFLKLCLWRVITINYINEINSSNLERWREGGDEFENKIYEEENERGEHGGG